MNKNDDSVENELLDIMYSYRKAQLLSVAAKLGFSDLLEDGPKYSDEIAKLTKSDPDAVYRALRALSCFGIYKEKSNRCFEITSKGKYLLKNHPSPVRIEAIMRTEEYNWKPWGDLLYSVKTGKSSFEHIFDMNLFEYLSSNPSASKTFSEAMGKGTDKNASAFLETYDFTPFKKIADIGGCNGDLINRILSINKTARGVLFDLPSVIKKADLTSLNKDVLDRLEVIEGSFFDQVPPGCDLYVLKKIIHDWDDEHSLQILEKCYDSCPKGARIVIAERVIDEQGSNSLDVALTDIHMLVQTIGGRERTREEYFDLLSKANFQPLSASPEHVEGIKQ